MLTLDDSVVEIEVEVTLVELSTEEELLVVVDSVNIIVLCLIHQLNHI